MSSGAGVPSLWAKAAASMLVRTIALLLSGLAKAVTASESGRLPLGSRRASASSVDAGATDRDAVSSGTYCRCA